jgi:bifunctional non-homologous end joining protein LigD
MTPGSDTEVLTVGRRRVAITHPGKPLFADPVVTKRELARHYEAVAGVMLSHVRGRPLALEVFPQGVAARGFYVKRTPAHFPDWIKRVEVPKRGGSNPQVLVDHAATLVFLAGQNVVTPHVWLSRAEALRRPDRLVVDLDPAPGIDFAEVRAAAREVGARLRAAGLAVFAMVTGSRGVHVVSPLRRGPDFSSVHAFARHLAEALVAEFPDRLTLEWHRNERGRRIYLDVNRNAYAQHVVAPYGVRARAGAPVAMPIGWEELDDPTLRPDGWRVGDAARRVGEAGDPWAGMGRRARALPDVPAAAA